MQKEIKMTKVKETVLGHVSGTKICLDGSVLLKINGKWYSADNSVDTTQLYMYDAWEINDKSCMQFNDEFPTAKPI